MITNYYESLKLTSKALPQEVAENYRKLALRYHPTSTKEDPAVAEHIFNDIAEAYSVLSDPVKRAFYDKYGYEALKQGLYNQGQLKGGYRFANNAEEIFEGFFKSSPQMGKVLDLEVASAGGLFGHAFGGLNYQPDELLQNLLVKVACTLEELYSGTSKLVTYNRKTLNSDGRTTSIQFSSKMVHIKAGYGGKTVLNFPKEGNQTVHGVTSDLLLQIEEIPNIGFLRKGDDLIYTHNMALSEAFGCGSLSIQTLDGRSLSIGVDEMVSPRSLHEIVAEGMVNISTGQRGSLFIRFNLSFPEQLSEQTRNQLRTLLQK